MILLIIGLLVATVFMWSVVLLHAILMGRLKQFDCGMSLEKGFYIHTDFFPLTPYKGESEE